MLKRQQLVLILNIILILACIRDNSQIHYLDFKKVFNVNDTLNGFLLKETSTQDSAWYGRIHIAKEGLIVYTAMENEIFFLIDSTTGTKISSGGMQGRGANEMLSAISSDYDDSTGTLFCWDVYKKSIHSLHVSNFAISYVNNLINVKESVDFYRIGRINDSIFAALSFCPDQSIGTLGKNGYFISKLPYKLFEDKGLNYLTKYFDSALDVSPDKKRIVVVNFHYPSLRIYEINKGNIELKIDKMYFKPEYQIENGWFKSKDNNPLGFIKVCYANRYIYALSYGIKSGDWRLNKHKERKYTYLLKFDLEGNFIKNYILNDNIEIFDIASNGKTIYCACRDNRIIKYELN
ncbi:MAG: BF3164 family lipoprotein [Bacteroidales bacterium]